MLDERKTKGQLITELSDLRQRLIISEQEQKKLRFRITERKRAEDIMHARLRLLKFAESHSLEEFTQATLDEAEDLTASTIGFYHLLEADQRTLSLQTWSTNTLQRMCTAAGKGRHYDIAEAGVWVDCVHQRRPVIHNNYDALPHRKGMPPGHALVARELVVPIFRANKIVAIIGVGNKPSDYDELDVQAVSLLGDLSWDITERKKAEEALRDREAKYLAAVKTSSDGFCITDMTGRFLEVNDSFAVLLGYRPDEMLSMSVPDIEAQLTPAEIAAAIEKVRREGRAIFETKHRTKDGRVCPVEVNLAYWPIADGRMFVFLRDITVRKQAEMALRDREDMLRFSLDAADIGFWELDLLNHTARRSLLHDQIFGYRELLPQWTYEMFLEHVFPEDRLEVDRKFQEALKAPHDWSFECRIRRVDKAVRWIWVKGRSRFNDQGMPVRMLGLVSDITERKQAEEALKKSRQDLRLLTSQLLTVQEKERWRIARELHDELGQALTVLKIKLVAIEDELTPNKHPLKAKCEQMLSHIDTVIENVRRLSWDLRPSSLEDLGLSSALRNLVEETCRNHNLQSSVEMDEIDHLFSPEVQINIYRIFQESLTNVVKHARASQVSAEIFREKGQVSFMIRDDGRGFNMTQAMSGRSAKRSLGLTAINERVFMAQGSLQIASRRGRGTTIAFVIPTIKRGRDRPVIVR